MKIEVNVVFDGETLDPVDFSSFESIIPYIENKEAWAREHQIGLREYTLTIGEAPITVPREPIAAAAE